MNASRKHHRVLVWMRRAMRVVDHAPLWHAVQDAEEVVPLLVLSGDPAYREDTPRRRFVRDSILEMDAQLRRHGSRLHLRIGAPERELPAAAEDYGASAVYAARIYDAPGLRRDAKTASALRQTGAVFHAVKDRVMMESAEVQTTDGEPYRVFTPYKRRWLALADDIPRSFPDIGRLADVELASRSFTIDRLWKRPLTHTPPAEETPEQRLQSFLTTSVFSYDRRRDLPGIDGTSRLSHHLALGTISPRQVYWATRELLNTSAMRGRVALATFIGELIWREFYYHILAAFPSVLNSAFRQEFRTIRWSRSASLFDRWKRGETGYPIVDAGMRQLSAEGRMHNRVRMIAASFLTKDLHINWQWGERHFAEHLMDLDIASNNGGWQWCAGTGTDASPWFRIFNPVVQAKRFDPDGAYVRRYIPELARLPAARIHEPWLLSRQDQEAYGCVIGTHYPRQIVDHAREREATITLYSRPGKGKL